MHFTWIILRSVSKLQFPNIKLTIFHSFIVLSLCISVQRSLINFHHCSEFKVEHIFADNAQVKSWNVFGLPDNRFAIESAVILQLSGLIRWKIFIIIRMSENNIRNSESDSQKSLLRNNPEKRNTSLCSPYESRMEKEYAKI